MKENLAPICLFVYNRLEDTIQTVNSLKANYLAEESDLIIYSDGFKDQIDKRKVLGVRSYIKKISGFKSIKIRESANNKGLATSIIDGVNDVLTAHDTIIVLEDDLITTPNFLDFMNKSLDFYESYKSVISVSGFTLPINFAKTYNKDVYFSYRASSWGWAIWKDRWNAIEWSIDTSEEIFKDRIMQISFNRGGQDMYRMLRNQITGKIDSWAIRFCYHQFKTNKLTVMPTLSKINNIGFNSRATHTKSDMYAKTILDLDNKIDFVFSDIIKVDLEINSQLRSYYSLVYKIKHKILQFFK